MSQKIKSGKKASSSRKDPPFRTDFVEFHGLEIQPFVFFGSAGLILFALLLGTIFASVSEDFFKSVLDLISTKMGWFYILVVNILLGFSLYLLFGRHGKIRLGGESAKPYYSRVTWFAMLFSAGMGIGLLFYSVAEPIMHFSKPPLVGEPFTSAAAREAMTITFFHWGIHAWAIYAVVAVCIAYFSFNKRLPMTIRSSFYPILGEKIYGPWGRLIDVLAVVATLFGVATSLGLGAKQINAGLHYIFDFVPFSAGSQIVLIAVITLAATISVVMGLDKGIRKLSEFNMCMAGLLLVIVFLFGPTVFILNGFLQNLGSYADRIIGLSFWAETYLDTDWQHGWTLFYWGWWIAWSPFVGMFIARISYGRTIREFMTGVLLVPTLLTFIWLSIFGNAALHRELFGAGGMREAVQENVAISIFVLLEGFPFHIGVSCITMLVVATFFVTSSDSGSLVIDTITAGGHPHPPVIQKVFWAVLEGTVAAVLLFSGGLVALQAASISTGIPFACVLLLMCVGLQRSLSADMTGKATNAVVKPELNKSKRQ